jgi:hypothetical protein
MLTRGHLTARKFKQSKNIQRLLKISWKIFLGISRRGYDDGFPVCESKNGQTTF